MRIARVLPVFAWPLFAALLPAGAAGVEFPRRAVHATRIERGSEACSTAARAERNACRFDSQADYWNAMGICTNVGDAAERKDCDDEAASALREALDECAEQHAARLEVCELVGEDPYEPDFDPARFVDPDEIGSAVAPNPYFPLVVGTEWRYESGEETTVVTVTDKTKLVAGVTCRVIRDEVSSEGAAIEITDDWVAQDLEGNVWYCGESVREYEVFDGDDPEEAELVSIDGSFKVGRGGAKPGILMYAAPVVGAVYREEAAPGEAEDLAEILDVTGSESAPAGSCDGTCVVTRNFQPLEPGVDEFKYYAPGVGLLVEIDADGGRVELVSFTTP